MWPSQATNFRQWDFPISKGDAVPREHELYLFNSEVFPWLEDFFLSFKSATYGMGWGANASIVGMCRSDTEIDQVAEQALLQAL